MRGSVASAARACRRADGLQVCQQIPCLFFRQGDQKAAGSLGIEQNLLHGEGYVFKPYMVSHVIPVALPRSG